MMTIITITDAVQHVVLLSGISLAKNMWLNTFMASSVGGIYGHLLTIFLLGLFPVWLLLGVGFALSNDFSTGQAYNVVSRIGLAKYIRGHYYAAGIAGVILFAVPLLVNLLTVAIIQLLDVRKSDGQMRILYNRGKIPDLEKYHFLWWQLEHPVVTYFLYLGLFLIAVILTSMLMVSLSLLFNNFYQILSLVVLTTVILGSQIFNIGSLLQTFAFLLHFPDWVHNWLTFLSILLVANVVIYLWRHSGELQ
ncbi:hypothetical protein FFIC_100050 [Fructobacillus ficulneus]|uniref:Uncharacterized protein n=2 Tax=Fructobacillus ficulneus TaxID=157463 RepID=A0A0K8MHN8_9LACO|nr:hypothetical protein FFIC_100050 [Fructobacillus ficulneus]